MTETETLFASLELMSPDYSCDGKMHAAGLEGHDAAASAVYAVRCVCECDLSEAMLLCAARVDHVLNGGKLECHNCGKAIDSPKQYWVDIVRLGRTLG